MGWLGLYPGYSRDAPVAKMFYDYNEIPHYSQIHLLSVRRSLLLALCYWVRGLYIYLCYYVGLEYTSLVWVYNCSFISAYCIAVFCTWNLIRGKVFARLNLHCVLHFCCVLSGVGMIRAMEDLACRSVAVGRCFWFFVNCTRVWCVVQLQWPRVTGTLRFRALSVRWTPMYGCNLYVHWVCPNF